MRPTNMVSWMATRMRRTLGAPAIFIFATALAQLTLSGCATPMQQTANADRQAYESYLSQSQRCFSDAANNPLNMQVALHLSFAGPGFDTEAMRADAAIPSIDDAIALQTLKIDAGKCAAIGVSSPHLQAVAAEANALNDQNLAVLIERQESWGEYVTTRDTISYELGQYEQVLTASDLSGQAPMRGGWNAFLSSERSTLQQRADRIAPRRTCRAGFGIDCTVVAGAF